MSGVLRWDGEAAHEGSLQRVRENGGAGPVHLFQKLIVDAACQASGEPACKRSAARLSAQDGLPVQWSCSRLFAGKKDRPHLHTFGTERETCNDAAGIRDSSSCYDGYLHRIHDLRYQRERACEGIFRGAQERSAMSASLKSGCHNHIDTGLIQSDGLVRCCRGADRENALAMALFENFLRRNAEDERESRDLRIEQNAHLIFEAKRFVWGVLWLARADRRKMRS